MNMLANQSKCDKNLQIYCTTFWWIFFILCRFYSFYAFLCINSLISTYMYPHKMQSMYLCRHAGHKTTYALRIL